MSLLLNLVLILDDFFILGIIISLSRGGEIQRQVNISWKLCCSSVRYVSILKTAFPVQRFLWILNTFYQKIEDVFHWKPQDRSNENVESDFWRNVAILAIIICRVSQKKEWLVFWAKKNKRVRSLIKIQFHRLGGIFGPVFYLQPL